MSDEKPFVLVCPLVGRGASSAPSGKLFTLEEFFRRITHRYERVRCYTLYPNTGKASQLITKRRLKEEFQEYAQTPYYIQMMGE